MVRLGELRPPALKSLPHTPDARSVGLLCAHRNYLNEEKFAAEECHNESGLTGVTDQFERAL